MGVTLSSPDSPFARIAAVYRCRCGARKTRYGRLASILPQGWVLEDGDCRCARCAERRRDAERSEATPGDSA